MTFNALQISFLSHLLNENGFLPFDVEDDVSAAIMQVHQLDLHDLCLHTVEKGKD